MAHRIGITGNIGAGKTTVCREFERLGVPVYYADDRAKRLMTMDAELRAAVTSRFGAESYDSAGAVNRVYLSGKVFGDQGALHALNELVHPAVARDAEAWHQSQPHAAYTLHEAAILFEIGADRDYDRMVVVSCPLETRRQRVLLRDGISEAAFAARAARQCPDDRKEAAADHVVVNDGRTLLWPQVLALDRIFRGEPAPNPRLRR